MSIVAGVDFGTLSARVSLFDSKRGRLGAATAEYPLDRTPGDPDHATQSHADHLSALERAMRDALRASGVHGETVEAIALDTTGSSVIPVGENLEPLGDYYLWCDHRAWREAAEITKTARESGLEAIQWCGGTYSSEWGLAKLLHWLRHNEAPRARFVTALEHCDMVAATLCGITDPASLPRSICAMGHKWMWGAKWGGLPPDEFLTRVDPLLQGVRQKIGGRYGTSTQQAGTLSNAWAAKLGLRAGIPIPTGALDAHWDAIGAGIRLGDVVNVIGTSTCIMAISDTERLIPGVKFEVEHFTPKDPTDGKYGGQTIPGVKIVVTDRDRVNASRIGASLFWAIAQTSRDSLKINDRVFDERFGAARIREALLRGDDPDSVLDRELPAMVTFRESIKGYLLYR